MCTTQTLAEVNSLKSEETGAWKPCREADAEGSSSDAEELTGFPTARFSLYQELASKIKLALGSVTEGSCSIRITMPFDKIEFDGGLGMCGKKQVRNHTISRYQDLDRLLGRNWHYRGVNSEGDFAYAELKTVKYQLLHQKPLEEFVPDKSGRVVKCYRSLGDVLVFMFVKEHGSPERFGTDRDIFFH